MEQTQPKPRQGGQHRQPRHRDRRPDRERPKLAETPIVIREAIEKGVLKAIPLGGLGEVGKNMMAYEYENDIIIVDAGFMFPEDEMLGIDYVIPDIKYLEAKKDKIRAIILTHGHEDHIGGLPFILPKIPAPIYGTKLTMALVKHKLEEAKHITGAKLISVEPGKEVLSFGQFKVEFIPVTHSIPDAAAVVIRTPVGVVVHTGDFRFETNPAVGDPTDFHKLAKLGREGVALLCSDSTNASIPGFTISEKVVADTFFQVFEQVHGRIIIASFSSQLSRIQQIIRMAHMTGRKLAFSGRSMINNVKVAAELGYLKIPLGLIVKIEDIAKLPEEKVTILTTGSQGESMSALYRMAAGEHTHIKIKKGDTIILSSSVIPGNEKAIYDTINNLFKEGARVYREDASGLLQKDAKMKGGNPYHVTGHGFQEELKIMIQLVRPRYFLPVHGTYQLMNAHKDIANSLGYTDLNTSVLENGETLEITKGGIRVGKKVPSGIVLVDGLGVGDVKEVVLRDRQTMATDGIFVIMIAVDRRTGKLVSSPDIISRGFIYVNESEQLINKARNEVKRILERKSDDPPTNWALIKNKVRDDISRFLFRETKRRPMVLPVIIEV